MLFESPVVGVKKEMFDMHKLRRMIQIAASTAMMFGLAAGVADASTLLDYTVTGNVALLSTATANPNSETVSFAGFSAAQAQTVVTANCPSGFTCSFGSLQEIDLGLNVATSGTVSIVSSVSTAGTIGCFLTGSDNCSTGNSSTGVAVEGLLSVTATDPLGNSVLATGPIPSFSPIATNSGFNTTKVLNVAGNSSNTYSGSGTYNPGTSEIYDTTDPTGSPYTTTWAQEAAAYTGGNVNLALNLGATYQAGSVTGGITVGGTNTAVINSGTVTAEYFFNYTESAIGSTPEPATLFLMGSALVGIGLLRKRVKS
jgi:PEP-CTERM motif-containing protein